MQSRGSLFLTDLYTDWSTRLAANPDMSIADVRSMFDSWHNVTLEPEGVTYRSDVLAGLNSIWALPIEADHSKVVLYCHGGGFSVGSAATHRKLLGQIVCRLGVIGVAIDYRLAPEFPFPAQLEDAAAAYKNLRDQGYDESDITIAGDSAGGNLAIATVLQLQQQGTPLPGSVIAFSPWLDMELVGETLVSNDGTDALVHRPLLEGMCSMFLGESGSRTDPLTNPLKADFRGFPRLYVNAGSLETLLDNALDLVDRARAAGVDATLSVVEDMQHVFPFLAGRAKEADDELDRLARWYQGG